MSTCNSDLFEVGMQRGEEAANILRLIAVMVVASALSAWFNSLKIKRMILMFLHWVSGFGYASSQLIMSIMVINCWSTNELKPFIYTLKFLELWSVNVFSLSNLALTINLAHIVEGYKKCQRVSGEDSQYLAKVVVVVGFLMAMASVPFWDELLVTGGYFWVASTGQASYNHWINLSFSVVQTASGILMTGVLSFVVSRRWKELLQCTKNRRVRLYFVLSVLGTVINLFNGIAVILDETIESGTSRELVMIGWSVKYIHISLDTSVFLNSLRRAAAERPNFHSGHRSDATSTGLGGGQHQTNLQSSQVQPNPVSYPLSSSSAQVSVNVLETEKKMPTECKMYP